MHTVFVPHGEVALLAHSLTDMQLVDAMLLAGITVSPPIRPVLVKPVLHTQLNRPASPSTFTQEEARPQGAPAHSSMSAQWTPVPA